MNEQTKVNPVAWFRSSAPYINAHRGKTVVIAFGGEALEDPRFAELVHDIALLHALGLRLVIVHGSRPQIDRRLSEAGITPRYVNGLRVTDSDSLPHVMEAAGCTRVAIEALLSMGLPNTPMQGARLRVTSGNFVIAKPYGVHDGIDFQHTGEVRRVDTAAIEAQLAQDSLVLLSNLGYSATGEMFNLSTESVATEVAVRLRADKLIYLMEGEELRDARRRSLTQLTLRETAALLGGRRKLSEELRHFLHSAQHACQQGVKRVHLLSRRIDGALLLELYTRDGCGTLVTSEPFEELRRARIDDVGGILELIAPLEAQGTLVRRSREQLELEIEHFTVFERDGMAVACAAFYPFPKARVGELACLAVHPDYRNQGRGDALLERVEADARELGVERIFVLTTHTTHWFRERGFKPGDLDKVPVQRRALYNYQRNSKILIKELD
jgi:amino-acid N-acetyltransferase